jgi:hypothetical protein
MEVRMKMGSINHAEMHKAAKNWAAYKGIEVFNPFTDERFMRFIGWKTNNPEPRWADISKNLVAIPEHLVNLFHALNGPHIAAIIKIRELNNEDQSSTSLEPGQR